MQIQAHRKWQNYWLKRNLQAKTRSPCLFQMTKAILQKDSFYPNHVIVALLFAFFPAKSALIIDQALYCQADPGSVSVKL